MSDLNHAQKKPIKKLLVANRGEIAIRIFRSAVEHNVRTVAIYSYEDRFSLHRYKADEAYQVGGEGSPVQAYLNIDTIVDVAKRSEVDAIHPGYGFLSENAEFREKVEQAGIRFVGPDTETLEVAGNKIKTRELAERVEVPTIPGSSKLSSFEDAAGFARQAGYPVIIKAAHGGGGRGMRVVEDEGELENSYREASQEALSAFGSGEVYVEKYLRRPKHLEVQLVGDGSGEVVHLFERDCSVQRRHQKVIEFAPSIAVSNEVKGKLYKYAVQLGKALSLKSLATAEFLTTEEGDVFFIEINPRIQVEHTVTEEITGFDLVRTQLRLVEGASLSELGLEQEKLSYKGVAIQCRITTEDPQENFMPDYGRIVAYRSAAGFGVRLDAGSAFAGGVVSPFYDSMLVKVTARGQEMQEAAMRLRRSVREFRIRGVKTNIQFLEKLLSHPEFLAGECCTTFLNENPDIFVLPRRRDRANRLLRFLSDVTVNGHDQMAALERPSDVSIPHIPLELNDEPPSGWRTRLLDVGKEQFLKDVRNEKRLLLTDTTLRDAHQSLLATRMRTYDMLKVAGPLAKNVPELFSLEMWGGATFDVCMRFLREDPWARVENLREQVPNILFQMLIRGANVVGYASYPDNVVRSFVKEAHDVGIDIFRVFDCFNSVEQMKPAINAVQEAGAIAEVCICYTGDVRSEEDKRARGEFSKYDLEYYQKLAENLVEAGADIIAIKDMAGLLRPESAKVLVSELRRTVELPIHFHTHDTAGAQVASYINASEAGVDIVDCAFSSMSGVTSQPTLEGVVAALEGTERDTGVKLETLTPFSSYWETVRRYYQPFESDLRSATGEVYLNEIPGGQYSNFRPQAASLGLADQWDELKRAYADVNKLFGNVVKVTPSSKVVGDLAIFMVANGLSAEDVLEKADTLSFPASVIGFFRGEIGTPYGGFPEELRSKVLRGDANELVRPGDSLPPADFEAALKEAGGMLQKPARMRDALSLLLYPHVFKEYAEARVAFSDLSLLPSMAYFYGLLEGEEIEVDLEPGKRLFIQLVAVSEPGENGERTVFFELNGQPRSIVIRDRSIAPDDSGNEQADSSNDSHIGAPLAGALVALSVEEGQAVSQGDELFTLEAMKMQTVVEAPKSGTISRVVLESGSRVAVGDLIVELN